jgi:hypothetical protein
LKEQKGTYLKQASIPSNVLLTTYNLAYGVAKCKKTRSILEELILPAAVEMVNIMVGECAGRLLSNLPLYNNTINSTIQGMTEDLNDH